MRTTEWCQNVYTDMDSRTIWDYLCILSICICFTIMNSCFRNQYMYVFHNNNNDNNIIVMEVFSGLHNGLAADWRLNGLFEMFLLLIIIIIMPTGFSVFILFGIWGKERNRDRGFKTTATSIPNWIFIYLIITLGMFFYYFNYALLLEAHCRCKRFTIICILHKATFILL